MQPVKAQKGASTRSHLFDSLKVYLNNKSRLQPIIGLGSIIECVKAGTRIWEALYLCEVCVCRLSSLADIRNHIMGSLHRYNYIRAWHPYLVSEWKEDSDLSKLAWPLMEKAKILEGKEGPGDVQFLELEEAIYQKMAACSENDAVTLINILRDGQIVPDNHSGTTSVRLEEYPVQSQRIVLLAQNQQRRSERRLNKTSTPLSDSPETSLEPSTLLENRHSFLDSYKGTTPLIGSIPPSCDWSLQLFSFQESPPGNNSWPRTSLFRVVECISEDGHTYGFLCHCCRIRSKKRDIIDHLTSSSHLVNYLMETHPEQVEVMMADINNNYQLLQSLAKKVEQVEGRGQLKVVNIPESLCILLAGKSYHWCIKMISNGWSHTNIQKRKTAVKGPSVNTTAKQGMPQSAVVLSETAKMNTTMRKKRKVRNTVFQVSLPISKGSVLLKRTSFSRQVSLACSPLSDADLSPESLWTEDCDTGSFAVTHAEQTSQLQQDLFNGDGDAGQYMGPEKDFVSHYQEVEGYYSDNEYKQFNQSENVNGAKDPWFHGERNYNRECDSQERLNKRFREEGQWQSEGPQTQNEWLSPVGSHPWHWSSCNASYRPEVGFPEQWYYSASQSEVGTGVNVSGEKRQKEMSSDATQYSHQQHPQDQYMARDYASLTGSVGQSGELAPHLDATRINTHPHVGDAFAHSGNIAPQIRVQFSETEHREWQEYMDFTIGHDQTAQQNDVMQSTGHQAIQVVYGVMSNTNDNIGSTENPDQYFPSVFWS